MRAVVLGLCLALSALVAPSAVLARPAAQQGADDYQTRLLLWRQLVDLEVTEMASTVLDGSQWPDVAVRADWAARLSDLATLASRPAPGYESLYRAEIQPINDRLEAVAAALRVNRRDSAESMLTALRSVLASGRAPGGAPVADDSGASPLQPSPSSGEAAVDAAIRETQASCMAQAYRLGWRWESPLSPEDYLRQFWLTWLDRTGADAATVAASGDTSCDGLYEQAQQVTADIGYAVAARGGVLQPSRATTVSAQTDRDLAERSYRLMVSGAKIWLPDSMTCFLRASRTGLTSLRPGNDCQTVLDALTGEGPGSNSVLQSCAGTITQFRACLVGLWRDAYRAAIRWTPPPQYADFHNQYLGVLTLLNQAADNTTYSPPTGAPPLTAAQLADHLRDARNLVITARDLYDQSIAPYDFPSGR
jgi:hypothetical protein